MTIIDQNVQITNLERFTDYNIALLDNDEVDLSVSGRSSLHEMKFPATTVDYDKIITMKGNNIRLGLTHEDCS